MSEPGDECDLTLTVRNIDSILLPMLSAPSARTLSYHEGMLITSVVFLWDPSAIFGGCKASSRFLFLLWVTPVLST